MCRCCWLVKLSFDVQQVKRSADHNHNTAAAAAAGVCVCSCEMILSHFTIIFLFFMYCMWSLYNAPTKIKPRCLVPRATLCLDWSSQIPAVNLEKAMAALPRSSSVAALVSGCWTFMWPFQPHSAGLLTPQPVSEWSAPIDSEKCSDHQATWCVSEETPLFKGSTLRFCS